jgi:aldoxime dehydratase
MTKNTPPGWVPPYPAFISTFPSGTPHLAFAQLGVQSPGDGSADALMADIAASLEGHASIVEQAHHVDAAGARNDVFLTYWPSQDAMRSWWRSPAATAWNTRPLDGSVGWWWEAFAAPIDHLETSYSTESVSWGIGRALPQVEDPIHAYFGAARDRISGAEDGGLPGEVTQLSARAIVESAGRRITVKAPGNVCFIRTVQGWSQCPPAEHDAFHTHVMPVYQAGVQYLVDEPVESGCISARLVDDVQLRGDEQIQAETLAWFTSFSELERWTHTHPTHLEIFQGFLKHAQSFNFQIKVVLGHEVVIVPSGNLDLEYANCHPATGFLGWFN